MRSRHRPLAFGLGLLQLQLTPMAADAQERERRDHSGFSAIEVSSGIDLYLRQGENFAVEIAASGGDPSDVISEVSDATLKLRRKPSGLIDFIRGGDYSAYVTLPKLESLAASGGADVKTQGAFSGDTLRIVASGGCDIVYSGNPEVVDVDADHSADVRRR
jgi:hypothetical protein